MKAAGRIIFLLVILTALTHCSSSDVSLQGWITTTFADGFVTLSYPKQWSAEFDGNNTVGVDTGVSLLSVSWFDNVSYSVADAYRLAESRPGILEERVKTYENSLREWFSGKGGHGIATEHLAKKQIGEREAICIKTTFGTDSGAYLSLNCQFDCQEHWWCSANYLRQGTEPLSQREWTIFERFVQSVTLRAPEISPPEWEEVVTQDGAVSLEIGADWETLDEEPYRIAFWLTRQGTAVRFEWQPESISDKFAIDTVDMNEWKAFIAEERFGEATAIESVGKRRIGDYDSVFAESIGSWSGGETRTMTAMFECRSGRACIVEYEKFTAEALDFDEWDILNRFVNSVRFIDKP